MSSRSHLKHTLRAALFACAILAPQAASAQYVDLPGTQPGGLNEATPLDNASACGLSCHYSADATMPSAMPYDGWLGSMMGNAMRDPLFLAALTVAEQDRPGVGDYCLRCHTPQGFVAGRTRGTPTAPLGARLEFSDRDGVNCDSCHRMVETTNVGNAQYVFSPTETRFGPYATINSIRHPGARSTWTSDSRLCGTCHNITNPTQPLRRADGTDTGQRFPLDTTYSEWAQSDFAMMGSPDARTCQDCHMPRYVGSNFVSSNKTAMLRDNPRTHDFAGANAWAIRMLAAMRNDVASGEFYDPDAVPFYERAAVNAEATLRSSVTLEWRQVPRMATPGQRVEVTARITNRSGHRLPTGYADGRRVWLEVALIDSAGRETVVSGAYDTAQAHLDTTDTQLRLYETLHGRIGIGVEEHIALHDTIVKDTRIPPRGYRPLRGHEPVGADYSGGANGSLRHWDDAVYNITIPATARGVLTVRVRARYQATTREYVEFLEHENRTDNRGRELLARYNASGRAAPYNMAETTAEIVLPGGRADGGLVDGGATSDVGGIDAGPPMPPPEGCNCSAAGSASPSARHGSLAAGLFMGVAVIASRRRRRRVIERA